MCKQIRYEIVCFIFYFFSNFFFGKATAVPTGQMTLMMARVNEAKLSTLNMRMTVLVDEELLILG